MIWGYDEKAPRLTTGRKIRKVAKGPPSETRMVVGGVPGLDATAKYSGRPAKSGTIVQQIANVARVVAKGESQIVPAQRSDLRC